MAELTGKSIIGFQRGADSAETFFALAPASGEKLPAAYHSATESEIDQAVRLADSAFAVYGRASGKTKAAFLRKIADNIESIGEPLTSRAARETALAVARIQMETARTCNQLRMFADLVEEGSWVDARIDRADPARQPAPKPDIRSMLRPLGPVVVFGASNFPLAFSVAGGDTASALAAGCPVIVKAHPAHPGTSEMVGLAAQEAARECGLPEGVFSLIFGAGNQTGLSLVTHPLVAAVGFTGSRAGGRALMEAVRARPCPIPFYAEMSSINPVFILAGAMRERGDQIAAGLHTSVTLGAGQFCTNPGLVVMADDDAAQSFTERLAGLIDGADHFTMLTPGISQSYSAAVRARFRDDRVETITKKKIEEDSPDCRSTAALFRTNARTFLENPELSEEVFGPSTLLIAHRSREEMLSVARSMEGQLTATVWAAEEDRQECGDLIAVLENKVGRIVINGFPTGVEVCSAMTHGGPFPATSDGQSTSVGTRAINRFARAVCYQGFSDSMLPDELKDENPLGVWRTVDGRLTR